MATPMRTPAEHPPIHVGPGTVTRPPSHAVARQAAAAARATTHPVGVTPAVYHPWTQLLEAADRRYKTEIAEALRVLQAEAHQAGHLLDQAQANAQAAAAPLEQAAHAEYHARMAAADRVREEIMHPAAAEYGDRIATAHHRYTAAIEQAERTYKTIADDAHRAESDAKSIAS